MNLHYNKTAALQSILIYCTGDLIAALLTDNASLMRTIGIAFIAATFYTIEIPNYFRWINARTQGLDALTASIRRTLFAMAYFNPLWIARHLFVVQLFSGQAVIEPYSLLVIASKSFLVNIPISAAANYLIQNHISLNWRFLASSLFSAAMAVYYAMSQVWFS